MAKIIKFKKYKKTDNMVKQWDIVVCRTCGKEMHMCEGRLVDNRYFVHKGGCK